jgi:large subunit ribosomal protein L8e
MLPASIRMGKNAQLAVGNIPPVFACPEGIVICNVEEKLDDRGTLARPSTDENKTRIWLPSGAKMTISSSVHATVGIVASGGHIGKPFYESTNEL